MDGMEQIIKGMLVNTKFLTKLPKWSDDSQFSASEMEVKLIEISQPGADSFDRFKLGFFLNRSSHRYPGMFNHSLRSIPFGRIIEGRNVIEFNMNMLSPDERKCVKVEIEPQEEESWD